MFLACQVRAKNVYHNKNTSDNKLIVMWDFPDWEFHQQLISNSFLPIVNSLRPRQNGRHFADDIFNCISLIENIWTPIKISLKFVSVGPINNIPALVRIMLWRRPGDKPLSEPMMDSLPMHICVIRPQWVNILRLTQNCCHFTDDIFKSIFLNENVWTSLQISLKFVPKFRISNIPALVQIMAWHRPGNKPLSEQMMVSLLMHICITQPQWVNHFPKMNFNQMQISYLATNILEINQWSVLFKCTGRWNTWGPFY